jgi:hypothetical protein
MAIMELTTEIDAPISRVFDLGRQGPWGERERATSQVSASTESLKSTRPWCTLTTHDKQLRRTVWADYIDRCS